jgi:methanethiol S-methyltransferase
MGGILALAYGTVCYAVFLVTFLYAVGFVSNLVVPKSIDTPSADRLGIALLVDVALLAVFAVQHSVMARPAFKRWWTRIVPESVERSTYVLLSSVALALLFWQWRGIDGIAWEAKHPVAVYGAWAVHFGGWGIVLFGTFLINHFDLFGLRQVYLRAKGRDYTHLPFNTPALYRIVRHPIMVGFLLAFWGTPTMTVGHLVFALATTACS